MKFTAMILGLSFGSIVVGSIDSFSAPSNTDSNVTSNHEWLNSSVIGKVAQVGGNPRMGGTPRVGGTPGGSAPPASQTSCDLTEADKICKKMASKEEARKLIDIFKQNKVALSEYDNMLFKMITDLRVAREDAGKVTEGFKLKLAGSCGVAMLEAVAVSQTFTKLGGACVSATFGYNCISQGTATTKEVLAFAARDAEVKDAIVSLTKQSASVMAKVNAPGGSGWVRTIPLVGAFCRANDWGEKIFSLDDLLKEIGNSIENAMRAQIKVKKLIKENDAFIAQYQAILDRP